MGFSRLEREEGRKKETKIRWALFSHVFVGVASSSQNFFLTEPTFLLSLLPPPQLQPLWYQPASTRSCPSEEALLSKTQSNSRDSQKSQLVRHSVDHSEVTDTKVELWFLTTRRDRLQSILKASPKRRQRVLRARQLQTGE
jgi:hypothetical protein